MSPTIWVSMKKYVSKCLIVIVRFIPEIQLYACIMPSTSKLVGHIALGLSGGPFVTLFCALNNF